MTQKELYEKVQLLKAGQIVEINGDNFRAKLAADWDDVILCNLCELDSICHGDVAIICDAMDTPESRHWFLKLAHA